MSRISLTQRIQERKKQLRKRQYSGRALTMDALEPRMMMDAAPIPGLSDELRIVRRFRSGNVSTKWKAGMQTS